MKQVTRTGPITGICLIIMTMAFLGAVLPVVAKCLAPHPSHAPVNRLPAAVIDKKVLDRAKSWTVLISNEGFESKYRGTGMLIDATHVLTADHMVSTNGNEMWIYVAPGRRVVHAKPVIEDSSNDLAVLELD